MASESVDRAALIRFGPSGAAKIERERSRRASCPPTVEGPHGIAMSPDGQHYYVTTAHGTPFGRLPKYAPRRFARRTSDARQLPGDGPGVAGRRVRLRRELQPARRDGAIDISVVAADEMVEVARMRRARCRTAPASTRRAVTVFRLHDGRPPSRSTPASSRCRAASWPGRGRRRACRARRTSAQGCGTPRTI